MSIETGADTPAYARFTRRLQGVCIDSIVLMLMMVSALIIATTFASDNIARILGLTFVVSWLLYEPLLVSLTGGTLGHYYCNIRVVDDRHGGNVGLGKAIARMVIKTVLGWYSFVSMAVTSRHQAVHDLLTQSTVQIRDLAKARPHHFNTAREALPTELMPSRGRRVVITLAYLAGCYVVYMLAQFSLWYAGLVSNRCLYDDVCSRTEMWSSGLVGLGWLGASALLLGMGWRGRLWGARRG